MQRLRVILGTSALVLTSAWAWGDTRIVVEERTQMMIPGNESDVTSEVTLWLQDDKAARVDASGRAITRLDRGELYIVNDAERSYTVLPISRREEGPESPPPQLEKTGETREIGEWTAERYELNFEIQPGETVEAVFWMSTDVDVDLEAYRAFMRATADAMGMSWMKSIVTVEGYPVLQESTMNIAKSTGRLVSISEASPPAGIYEPPTDYTKK